MQSQVEVVSSPEDVWRTHYATPRGFRHWPCEELVRSVGDRQLGVVLEAGCGNGANLWFLAEHAEQVIGIDGCVEALDHATKYCARRGVTAPKLYLQHADLRTLPVSDQSVDAVIDVMTSQHLHWSEYPELLAEYRRVLRPNGWLFWHNLSRGTTTLDATHVETFTYQDLPALFPGVSPVCLPQGPALIALLNKSGFHVTTTRQSSRTYPSGAVTIYHSLEAKPV